MLQSAPRFSFAPRLLAQTKFCLFDSGHPGKVEQISIMELVRMGFAALLLILCDGQSIHDNYVSFSGADQVSFHEVKHSIDSEQPYEGVNAQGFTLDVRAGRHKTEDVASDFKNGIQPLNALGLHVAMPSTTLPEALNFAIFGDLNITIGGSTISCPEMRIAQGSSLFWNNWWLASTRCYGVPDSGELTCKCGHGLLDAKKISISPGQDDHTFNVRLPEVVYAI